MGCAWQWLTGALHLAHLTPPLCLARPRKPAISTSRDTMAISRSAMPNLRPSTRGLRPSKVASRYLSLGRAQPPPPPITKNGSYTSARRLTWDLRLIMVNCITDPSYMKWPPGAQAREASRRERAQGRKQGTGERCQWWCRGRRTVQRRNFQPRFSFLGVLFLGAAPTCLLD